MPDVVLVDDDGLYREVLSADLADRGFSVSCFADGPAFLEALSNGIEAQIALLDWALPEMSGFELLGALRERGIGLPVVFLTGYSLVELELQALDHGAIDFVDKARGIEVLAHRLRVILEGQRQIPAATMPEVERHGELALYPSTARALWRQRDVDLTVGEYKVLTRLVPAGASIPTAPFMTQCTILGSSAAAALLDTSQMSARWLSGFGENSLQSTPASRR